MAPEKKKRGPRGGGSVFLTTNNGQPRYVAKITLSDSEGRKVTVSGVGMSKEEALKRRNKNVLKRMGSTGTLLIPSKVPKVSAYLDVWLTDRRDLTERSRAQYRVNLEKQVVPYLDLPLDELSKKNLDKLFHETLPEAGVGATATNNAYQTLRNMLNHAVKNGVIEVNPLVGVVAPKRVVKVNEDDRRYLDARVQIAKGLLRWVSNPANPHHEHYPLLLMMFLGLRRSENLGLEWACFRNISVKGKATVEVRQQLIRGKEGDYFIQRQTKTKLNRTILLPEVWRLALLDHWKHKPKAQEAWADDLVFLTKEGKPYSYRHYSNVWREVLGDFMDEGEEKGKPYAYWRPHANRRVTATLLAELNVPITTAMSILGHNTKEMTIFYATASAVSQEKAVKGLSEALGF